MQTSCYVVAFKNMRMISSFWVKASQSVDVALARVFYSKMIENVFGMVTQNFFRE